jgi:hypothetical protein
MLAGSFIIDMVVQQQLDQSYARVQAVSQHLEMGKRYAAQVSQRVWLRAGHWPSLECYSIPRYWHASARRLSGTVLYRSAPGRWVEDREREASARYDQIAPTYKVKRKELYALRRAMLTGK